MMRRPPRYPLSPYTTLFRSGVDAVQAAHLQAALPAEAERRAGCGDLARVGLPADRGEAEEVVVLARSEEHTSELQSRQYLVCRLLLEKKQKHHIPRPHHPLL